MAAIANLAYLREAPAERLPPPAMPGGVFGWLREKSLLVTRQYRAHAGLHFVYRLDRAATLAIPCARCGVVGRRPASLSCFAGTTRAGRVLGVRPRLVVLFRLWLLPDRRALAGRCVLPGAGVRHRLARLAFGAAPRHRRGLFLYCAAGLVLCSHKRRSAHRSCHGVDIAVGRHPGDHRRRDRGDRRLVAARHSPGAGPPLPYAGRRGCSR